MAQQPDPIPPPTREVQNDIRGRKIRIEVYEPEETQGPVPGILYLHELFGMKDAYRKDAADLASRGYLVYLPNLYTGGYAPFYCIRAAILESANSSKGRLNLEVEALLDLLKAEDRCNGSLGMIGMCMTGGFVLHMAKRPDMKAPVIYHHSLGRRGAGVPEEDNLAEVRFIQGHWAKNDPVASPPCLRENLKQLLGDRLELYEYNTKHGIRSRYQDHPEGEKAWERTLEFFERQFG